VAYELCPSHGSHWCDHFKSVTYTGYLDWLWGWETGDLCWRDSYSKAQPLILFVRRRNLLQLHHVHGGIICRVDNSYTQLSSQKCWYAWNVAMGKYSLGSAFLPYYFYGPLPALKLFSLRCKSQIDSWIINRNMTSVLPKYHNTNSKKKYLKTQSRKQKR